MQRLMGTDISYNRCVRVEVLKIKISPLQVLLTEPQFPYLSKEATNSISLIVLYEK